ncbi:hypothetical protein GCM10023107_77240 [Actinoplanes octamycinicus]|nr:hypothetical protein Aoc01nite_77040 [Actinoplanes octamycinicus]
MPVPGASVDARVTMIFTSEHPAARVPALPPLDTPARPEPEVPARPVADDPARPVAGDPVAPVASAPARVRAPGMVAAKLFCTTTKAPAVTAATTPPSAIRFRLLVMTTPLSLHLHWWCKYVPGDTAAGRREFISGQPEVGTCFRRKSRMRCAVAG